MAGALTPEKRRNICSFLLLLLLPCKLSSWRWALALPCGAWSICWRAMARITQHPNYKYLSDYDKKNAFDMEKHLRRRPAIVKPDEVFDYYAIDAADL